MSQATPRNPDDVNTRAIFTIGLAGAAVIFSAMIALEAFYFHDIAALENERANAGADVELRTAVSAQTMHLKEPGAGKVSIDRAAQLVIEDVKAGKSSLVPALGEHDKPTIPPKYGKPDPGAKWPPDPAPVEEVAPQGGEAPAEGAAVPAPAAPAAPAPAAPAAPAPAAPAVPGGNAP